MNWQPIETAPKDGSFVLLSDNRFKHPEWLIAQWCIHTGRWFGQRTNSGKAIVWLDASHWMPLPELPHEA